MRTVTMAKLLSHPSGVLTAFSQRSKNCRSPRFALCSRQQRCVRDVCALCHRLERHTGSGDYFEHAQRQRRGLAFAQRAVGTLCILYTECDVTTLKSC